MENQLGPVLLSFRSAWGSTTSGGCRMGMGCRCGQSRTGHCPI